MADSKITALTELAATPASNDWYVVTDVSDTTMDASGTNKKLAATRVVHKDTSGNVAVLVTSVLVQLQQVLLLTFIPLLMNL